MGRGARGAVTFPRLSSWQPVWTHPGAQGPSDINMIILSSITDYGKHLNTSVCLCCSEYLTAIHRLKLSLLSQTCESNFFGLFPISGRRIKLSFIFS